MNPKILRDGKEDSYERNPEGVSYEVQSADGGKTIVNTVIAKAADGTEDEAVSPGTEVTKPSTGGGVLNTKDHYSYIIGYKDGNVRPYGTVSRGEVATIFFRLLTDEPATSIGARRTTTPTAVPTCGATTPSPP